MAAKKKDPYSTQGLNDKASVQQALASAQYQPGGCSRRWPRPSTSRARR